MIDPKVVSSFLAVCEVRSFSQAARLRGISQPTITQHIQRLEALAGTALFVRGGRRITLTDTGESLRSLALRFDEAHEDIVHFLGSERRLGRIRFGAAEDFASTQLPLMLRSFTHAHPDVQFSLSVQEYFPLIESLKNEDLDLALVKQFDEHREPGLETTILTTDPLVWVSDRVDAPRPDQPVPLVTYRTPSMTRERVHGSLDRAGRDWFAACECQGLSGITAALRAGLGVGALPRSLVPRDLGVCPASMGLPELGVVEFALLRRPKLHANDDQAVDALADVIARSVLRSTQ